MCDCFFCKRRFELEKKRESIYFSFLFLLLIMLPIAHGAGGSSIFFDVNPNCSTNVSSFINCSQRDVELNCQVNDFQFVDVMTYTFNSTVVVAVTDPPPVDEFLSTITLSEQFETITDVFSWSLVTILDTQGVLSLFPQNIQVNKTCPDCFPDVVNTNSSCGTSNTFNSTFVDNNACGQPLPPNTTVACDFCTPDWQCKQFDQTCGFGVSVRNCLSIQDNNLCFNQTGLSSDFSPPPLSNFQTPCSFEDFLLNSTLLSNFGATLGVSQYPYAEVNTTVDFTVDVSFNGTNTLVDTVQIQFVNGTFTFNEDASEVDYDLSLAFSETGDFPFVVTGDFNNQTLFTINGLLFVRDFVTLGVELFENRNLSDRYENDIAEIVAFLKLDPQTTERSFTDDLVSSVKPFQYTSLLMRKAVKLNRSTYFDYMSSDGQTRAFHAPYIDGRAELNIPVEPNTEWELRIFNMEQSNEYIFDDFNFARISTLDADGSDDVYLTTLKATVDAEIKLLVSKWDIRFFQSATKIGLFLLLLITGIAILWWISITTEDPSLVVKAGVTLLGAIPAIYLALSFIIGFLA